MRIRVKTKSTRILKKQRKTFLCKHKLKMLKKISLQIKEKDHSKKLLKKKGIILQFLKLNLNRS